VITIKPFARGALLKAHDLKGQDADFPRELMAFVLENQFVDVCLCGVHTFDQLKLNFSASWTGLSPERREALRMLGGGTELQGGGIAWLEKGWLYA